MTSYGPHLTNQLIREALHPYRMHMNPDEAVRAHLDPHSQISIGIHFGLIDSAGESRDAPISDLIAARRAQGVDATNLPAPHDGQVFRY